MRSRWYLAVAIWIGMGWGASLWAASSAAETWAQMAQADGEMPIITAGPQNPQMTLEINDGIADLTALQVTVTAPPSRDIIIDTVTIGFGLPLDEDVTTGDESFLDELRVRLIIEDVEVNGIQDSGEVPEGTRSVTDLEDPTTVMFPLNPPLSLVANDTATFLVVVDINQPATQSAAMHPLSPMLAWWFLPILGFVAYPSRTALHGRCMVLIVLILCGCGLLLAGCSSGDDDDELRFVVNLPSNGLSGEGQRLGPESAVAGTTIRLMR